ncbi:hypothetical protein Q5P01_008708 [Channa striata]|uniref:Uncharacterized protein n=1 Tax=Channa striata TaxID=64152 RepID=A0AA88N5I6_CHASR|nr:hypothetical protein Q5P01_008708 [Channa striata]
MAEIRTQRPPNANEDLQAQTGCYGNLGTRASPRKRWGVFLHADGGPSLVPSPPQDWKAAVRQPMWVVIVFKMTNQR